MNKLFTQPTPGASVYHVQPNGTVEHDGATYDVSFLARPGQRVYVEPCDPASLAGLVGVFIDEKWAGFAAQVDPKPSLPTTDATATVPIVQDLPDGALITPASINVGPATVLPSGYARQVTTGKAFDLGGFMRELTSDMVNNQLSGAADTQMLLTVAAAALIEVARVVAPAAAPYLHTLCFPDDVEDTGPGPVTQTWPDLDASPLISPDAICVTVADDHTILHNSLVYDLAPFPVEVGERVQLIPSTPHAHLHGMHLWMDDGEGGLAASGVIFPESVCQQAAEGLLAKLSQQGEAGQ